MKRWILPLIGILTLTACSTLRDEGGDVVPAGAQTVKVAGGYHFTEGPAADASGNVYFSDQGLATDQADRILKWNAADNTVSVFMEGNCGRSNGMSFDHMGRLVTCADEKFEMWAIDPKTKQHTVLFDSYRGKALNGPNDVWIRLDGGMYFTDPYYQRPWWTRRRPEQDMQAVYFVPAGATEPIRVIRDFRQPNGIIGSPDGKKLYVSDFGSRQTWSYDIQPDGSLTDKQAFFAVGSDGMTIDDRGNVYLTPAGARYVLVCDPTGKEIARISCPEAPANVCFGGKDRHTLFMTARRGFYSIRLSVYGVGSQ